MLRIVSLIVCIACIAHTINAAPLPMQDDSDSVSFIRGWKDILGIFERVGCTYIGCDSPHFSVRTPDPQEDVWYAVNGSHSQNRQADAPKLPDHSPSQDLYDYDYDDDPLLPDASLSNYDYEYDDDDIELRNESHLISLQKKKIDFSLELASLEGTLREAARDAWSAVMEANMQADILLSKLSHGAGEDRLDSWVDNIKDDESVLRLYRDIIKKATEDASYIRDMRLHLDDATPQAQGLWWKIRSVFS